MGMQIMILNHRQQGFGLLEVLISILVLAVGFLGIAALQTQSLRFNHEAYLRTQATVLANDIADRMRANRSLAIGSNSYKFTFTDTPLASVTLCEKNPCSAGNIAAYDFAQWRANIASTLPNGKGAVTPDSLVSGQGWREYVIQIRYDSVSTDTATSTPTTVTLDYRTRI